MSIYRQGVMKMNVIENGEFYYTLMMRMRMSSLFSAACLGKSNVKLFFPPKFL